MPVCVLEFHSLRISIVISMSQVWKSYRIDTTGSAYEFGSLILTTVVQSSRD